MSRRGTVREDGMVFAKVSNGKELWLTPEDFTEWRLREIQRALEWQAKRSKEVGALLDAYKLSHGCAVCGYNSNTVALDFDHIDPNTKLFNIGRSRAKVSLEALWKEVAKCQVLCANCHRIKTFENGEHNGKSK